MKQQGLLLFIICALFSLLCSCTSTTDLMKNQKHVESRALLYDPVVRKNFHALKATAKAAHLYQQNGRVYLDNQDIRKLDAISAELIEYLNSQYHLNQRSSKIHTYVGKNQFNSCYQYYNSLDKDDIGKSCNEFSSSCSLCNEFINKVRSRKGTMIQAKGWHNESTTAFIDTTTLRNGDNVYVGVQFTVDE